MGHTPNFSIEAGFSPPGPTAAAAICEPTAKPCTGGAAQKGGPQLPEESYGPPTHRPSRSREVYPPVLLLSATAN